MNNPRQAPGVLGDQGNVEIAANVGAAMANEDSDPGVFSGDISFWWKHGFAGQGATRLAHHRPGLSGCATRFE